MVVERTEAPVDFVATGLVGSIKIDETIVGGQREARLEKRIAAGAWVVDLNSFAPREGDALRP